MRFLVTGAQGFLGAQVVSRLRDAGAVVIATGRRPNHEIFRCDLSVAEDVTRLVDQVSPDRIVHCAAQVPRSLLEYHDGISAGASVCMLDSLLSASACPIVFISSMTVYGTHRDRPISEHDAGDPTSAYGKGKWYGEQLLMSDGRPSFVVRIPGLFGPTRREGLVYNVVQAAKFGRSLELPTGPLLWSAMHIDDAASSIVKLALSPIIEFQAVNIGYRGKHSIETLVSMASEIYKQRVDYSVTQPLFEFDLTRAEIHDVVPRCNFREALVKFSSQI